MGPATTQCLPNRSACQRLYSAPCSVYVRAQTKTVKMHLWLRWIPTKKPSIKTTLSKPMRPRFWPTQAWLGRLPHQRRQLQTCCWRKPRPPMAHARPAMQQGPAVAPRTSIGVSLPPRLPKRVWVVLGPVRRFWAVFWWPAQVAVAINRTTIPGQTTMSPIPCPKTSWFWPCNKTQAVTAPPRAIGSPPMPSWTSRAAKRTLKSLSMVAQSGKSMSPPCSSPTAACKTTPSRSVRPVCPPPKAKNSASHGSAKKRIHRN